MSKKMGRIGRLMLVATLALGALAQPAMAATVTKTFTTHGQASANLLVYGGETFTLSTVGTSFIGTLKLQKSFNGSDFQNTTVSTAPYATWSATIHVDEARGRRVYFRVYCSTHTSGSTVLTMADVSDTVQEFNNLKGAVVLRLKDDGVEVPGTLAVTGAASAASLTLTTGLAASSIADGAITSPKMATASVPTAAIIDGANTSPKMAANSIPTAAIIDANVTSPKISMGSTSANAALCVTATGAIGICSSAVGSDGGCTCN